MRFNYENYKDEIVVDLIKEDDKKYPVLDMFTYVESDNEEDKTSDNSKQKIIDMVTAIVNSVKL